MTELTALSDDLLEAQWEAHPIWATLMGIRGHDHEMPDYSEAGDERRRARMGGIAARAAALDPAGQDPQERITRAVLLRAIQDERSDVEVRAVEYTVVDSFIAPVAQLLIRMSRIALTDRAVVEGYLARLAAIPAVLEALAQRHRAGIIAGRLPVRSLVDDTVAFIDRYLAHPERDPLRQPAPTPESGVDVAGFDAERERLLAERVHPAYARYREALVGEVAPRSRPDDRPGLCWLPGGEEFYAALCRRHTTTDRNTDDLHHTGLDLIARLDREYAEIGARALGERDPALVRRLLREDPALRWKDADALLAHARSTIARAEAAAPGWFGRLPSRGCQVRPVPDDEAPGAAGAYYMPPALDGSRSGVYYANTYGVGERHRYVSEATAFHEAVPGHHFQLTIAQELTGLPLLRRMYQSTAYCEGWGLYTERLADEMGLYSDDLSRLGMLTLDSMRAARLVVDTGLHAYGWSRERAAAYLRENTVMAEVDIESETDRYIAAPGQAPAYMVGRLEIQRLRTEATARLGDRFDIRAFHDTVLGNGALPLDVLADVVTSWVEAG
ncbi:DUF885 domain-containing protein [Planosporangium thailandense]|uniref:DUF885 domain-containing protein n=1 Tax=Planosporangium thailandense TaxID=765197 RepID=A0ABX0Y5F2_9ACTN|nr:DUF885 domain-containing protein [Planosporangium thailandense]NJC73651.1 DUF885 domain-containing protein [Planosporangium thailandense]